MDTAIPVIDFSVYNLNSTKTDLVSDEDLQPLASEFYNALSTVGFCYIKNHGLPQTKIEELFRSSRNFFTQPQEVKEKCTSPTGRFNGYQALEKERLTRTRPGDLKETFNFTTCDDLLDIEWPVDVPGMKDVFVDFFGQIIQFAHRVMDVMSLSLGLQDRNYLRNRHRSLGGDKSPGTLRSIYYPPLDDIFKPRQLRCGEHTDYGTVALLFQDDIGGLEIKSMTGEFIPVPPIKGTIIVNIGDLMQRWTADKLKATVHRVIVPEKEFMKHQCRQSAVLFVDPDDDVIIDCLDGSGKYEPVSSHDFVLGKVREPYLT